MGRAELKRLTVERFKSYRDPTVLELAPMTLLLGRNNSGKSTLIQALLLLKQTLAYPRADVPLHLEGAVDALHLRELTFGRPEGKDFQGPRIELVWESEVDLSAALQANGRSPDLDNLARHSGIWWIVHDTDVVRLETTFTVSFQSQGGSVVVDDIDLGSLHLIHQTTNPAVKISQAKSSGYRFRWQRSHADHIAVELDHFIPVISIDKQTVGPRHRQRTYYNGFKILYEQPLEDLRQLLADFHYLGSTRTLPPSIYRPASVPPLEVGVSGQYAAQMLHSRKADLVHFTSPLELRDGGPVLPEVVFSRPLQEAFNFVLQNLGIDAELNIEDVADVGFRILFGGFGLQHVGHGVSYLLPTVLLGLSSDPLRFREPVEDLSLSDYVNMCTTIQHTATEEPESHLHPKLQARLAHWFVALATAGRRLIVETHSDHLVRRLRGLIARSPSGSELEKWLAKNVVIAEIEQEDGCSKVTCMRLTEPGGIVEHWPADFMDEAAEEERSIYYAGLEKEDDESATYAADTDFVHDPSGE